MEESNLRGGLLPDFVLYGLIIFLSGSKKIKHRRTVILYERTSRTNSK